MQQFMIMQYEYRLRRPPRPMFLKLKPERVQEELKTMPGWSLHSSGKAIQRLYQFTSERAAANYSTYLSSCAGDAAQPVHLTVSGKSLTVKLFAPPRNKRSAPLDMGVIAFARQLN